MCPSLLQSYPQLAFRKDLLEEDNHGQAVASRLPYQGRAADCKMICLHQLVRCGERAVAGWGIQRCFLEIPVCIGSRL